MIYDYTDKGFPALVDLRSKKSKSDHGPKDKQAPVTEASPHTKSSTCENSKCGNCSNKKEAA